ALDNEPAPQGLLARILAVLQNNIVWAAIMAALVLAVAGLLIFKSRRDEQQAEAYAFDPVMPRNADVDELDANEAVPARSGILAAMKTRLSGNRRDDDDIFEDDFDEYGLPADAEGLPSRAIHEGVENIDTA